MIALLVVVAVVVLLVAVGQRRVDPLMAVLVLVAVIVAAWLLDGSVHIDR